MSRMTRIVSLGVAIVVLSGLAICQDAVKCPAAASGPASMPASAVAIGWRYDGNGRFPNCQPPTEWSAKTNIAWKTVIGSAYSSPVVAGGCVFATSEPSTIVCLDAASGKEKWKKELNIADLPPELKAKDPELPTQSGFMTSCPVSDGKSVFVTTGQGVVACFDFDGARKWVRWLDVPQTTSDGRCASPMLVAGKLLVHLGPLMAFDPATGKTLWRNDDIEANYGTPAIGKIGDVDIVVTPNGQLVRVSDGKVLASDMGRCGYTSPIMQDGVVYFIDKSISAVKLPDKADVGAKCKELWSGSLDKAVAKEGGASGEAEGEGGGASMIEFFASPLLVDGLIYSVDNSATLYVVDAATGKQLLTRTLKIQPAGQEGSNVFMYPSLCLAGKYIYITNSAGETVVMEAGAKPKEVKTNDLGEGGGGCAAFDGKRAYFRGGDNLFAIEAK